MSETRNLFVYGTLRRDARNELAVLLARDAHFVGEAVVAARLYDLGDYPGMIYPDNGHVVGEVFAISEPRWRTVISRLDEYEGCAPSDPQPHEYRRQVVEARLKDGTSVPAWAYVLNRRPNRREIESGDYLAWRGGATI